MRMRKLLAVSVAMMTSVALAGLADAGPVTTINLLVDVIPNSQSGEEQQNSEPSIAVNPNNQNQMIVGAFTSIFSPAPTNATTPFYISNNGGTIWADFGSLQTLDKSIAFNGSTPLATTLHAIAGGTQIQTFSSTNGLNFNNNINNFSPTGLDLDQPFIRTGPNNHVYVTYNNLFGFPNAKSASMNVSTDGGVTYATRVLETVTPGAGQDGPSVRVAVNGNTVYATFSRWNTLLSTSDGGNRFASQQIVVKSTDGGVTFSAGTQVALANAVFTTSTNSLNSLGQERIGSDNTIAVSRTNANRVVTAYVDSPAIGTIQVHVAESTDGGATWANKLTTAANVRSAMPAVTILDDGQVILLFNQFNPQTNRFSQHLISTSDDFATTTDKILGDETNATPVAQFDPYQGDWFDLISLGDTFYGVFSASNADDGNLANFLLQTPQLYQRCTMGTPGQPGFHLCDAAFSIDPYFFSGTSFNQVITPWPGTLALLGTSLLGFAALRRRRK